MQPARYASKQRLDSCIAGQQHPLSAELSEPHDAGAVLRARRPLCTLQVLLAPIRPPTCFGQNPFFFGNCRSPPGVRDAVETRLPPRGSISTKSATNHLPRPPSSPPSPVAHTRHTLSSSPIQNASWSSGSRPSGREPGENPGPASGRRACGPPRPSACRIPPRARPSISRRAGGPGGRPGARDRGCGSRRRGPSRGSAGGGAATAAIAATRSEQGISRRRGGHGGHRGARLRLGGLPRCLGKAVTEAVRFVSFLCLKPGVSLHARFRWMGAIPSGRALVH